MLWLHCSLKQSYTILIATALYILISRKANLLSFYFTLRIILSFLSLFCLNANLRLDLFQWKIILRCWLVESLLLLFWQKRLNGEIVFIWLIWLFSFEVIVQVTLFFKIYFYVYKYFVWIYVYAPHACLISCRSEDGNESSKTGITGHFDLPYGSWKTNPGPLQKRECSSLISHFTVPTANSLLLKWIRYFLSSLNA